MNLKEIAKVGMSYFLKNSSDNNGLILAEIIGYIHQKPLIGFLENREEIKAGLLIRPKDFEEFSVNVSEKNNWEFQGIDEIIYSDNVKALKTKSMVFVKKIKSNSSKEDIYVLAGDNFRNQGFYLDEIIQFADKLPIFYLENGVFKRNTRAGIIPVINKQNNFIGYKKIISPNTDKTSILEKAKIKYFPAEDYFKVI